MDAGLISWIRDLVGGEMEFSYPIFVENDMSGVECLFLTNIPLGGGLTILA